MQLNKCSRCGCFFMTNDSVCTNCKPKDMCDMNKLKSFFEEASPDSSIEAISHGTGISEKNLHRLISSDDFANLDFSGFNGPKIEL